MRLTRRTALSALGTAALVSTTTAERGAGPPHDGEVRISRRRTVVGSPVTVQGPEGVTWRIEAAPRGSDAEPHDSTAATTSIRPDERGTYVVAADTGDGTERLRFRTDARSELLERYAPRFHFHRDTHYRPTRIEAMLEHAELRRSDDPAQNPPIPGSDYPRKRIEDDPHDGETVAETPTVFDLAGRDDTHYMYLPGEREAYRIYQETYPPTVYANVTETTFKGESYTAVVYWYFYVFDPKHGASTFFEHQADLESCVVLLGDDGPEWFAAYQHGSGEFRRWEATPTSGTHPHVFVEKGAHASLLRDSSRYDGDGFLIQGYYVGGASPFSSGAETDPALSTVQTDGTGSAEVWSVDGAADVTYEVVPLVGNEVWASYEGGFSDAPGANSSAFQRRHFGEPGPDIEADQYPDFEHVDGTVEVYDASVVGEALTVDVGVKNWGPKPHPYWVSITAEPPAAERDDTVVLTDERFRVGTDREAFVRVNAGGERVGNTEETRSEITTALPEGYDDDWTLRASVWSYAADVRRAQDFHDDQVVDPGSVPS